MIVKGTKQLGSFKRGVNIYVPEKKVVVPAAPSGIPVASTASIVIGNAGAGNNGTYVKKVPQQLLIQGGGDAIYSNIAGACYLFGSGLFGDGIILFSPNAQVWDDLDSGSAQLGTPFGNWKLGYVYYEGGDISAWFMTEIATNPSTDSTTIPTSGWSPAITIAIAPSEIPVATTTNAIVTFGDTSGINYARDSYPTYTYYFVSAPTENIDFCSLSFNVSIPNTWALRQYSSGEEGSLVIEATNPSTNGLIIPTAGWTYTLGSGPAVTITAA